MITINIVKFIKIIAIAVTVIYFSLINPLNTHASANSTVIAEVHIVGGTNFIVYKIPGGVLDKSEEEVKQSLVNHLSESWEVKNARIENYHDGAKYTIFLEDFLASNKDKSVRFQIDPTTITKPFNSNQQIEYILISNKLLNWEINNESITQLQFEKEFTLLSEQRYVYAGTAESFESIGNQTYDGNFDINTIKTNSFIYYSLTILVLFCGYLMSQRFQFHILKNPHKKNKLRKVSQKYQVPVLICFAVQVIFAMTTGTLIVFEYFYGAKIGPVLSFAPIVVSALSIFIYFIRAQSKLFSQLESNSYSTKPTKELWGMFVPIVVPLTMTVTLNFILYIIPFNLFNFDSKLINSLLMNWLELIIISLAFLSAPILSNLLLPKEVLTDGHLRNKIEKLSLQNDVKFNKIYVIPSKTYRIANAMVSGYFNKNLYIYDYLLEQLDEEELDAIILHEIGHVKQGHLTKIFSAVVAILIVFQGAFYYLGDPDWYGVILYFISLSFMITAIMRKFEYQADEFSAKKMNDPSKVIVALNKITNANYMDEKTSKLSTILKTHPSIESRIQNLNK